MDRRHHWRFVSPFLFRIAEKHQLRSHVIGLIRAGHSASIAARTIGVPLATAKRWAKLFIENNDVSNRAIPGRPRVSTRKEDTILVREAENHPFLSAFELKMASNFPGSPLPVRRHLRERGIRSRPTATKEHLIKLIISSTVQLMILSGRISIGEMPFSPMRQLSLVAVMVLPACIALMATNTMNASWQDCCMLGVDVIRLGRNPRTDPRSWFTVDTYEHFWPM